jgi:hypothetical protein
MAAEVSMSITGKIIGYDPGGNGKHGVAALVVDSGLPVRLTFSTVRNTQAALDWFTKEEMPFAAGIDALTVLSTGDSGWRPADRWLREQYPQVRNSVVNANYLQGSVALNGLAVMISLRDESKNVLVSETHPKVLYYHLSGLRHDYQASQVAMNDKLTQWIGLTANTANDDEWDAVLSCFAVLNGISGSWPTDLHQLSTGAGERLVHPGGASHYFWPL